jgi:hypothetical protein
MKKTQRRLSSFVIAASAILVMVGGITHSTIAADNLSARPAVFVGTAPGCAPSPPGSNIVTAAWLRGIGLPDNLTLHNDNTTAANRADVRNGLLLSKNGLTTDCSAAGANILGVKGLVITAGFTLGYDYRNGGHCGAGAPRFSVDTDRGFIFVGCVNAPQVPAPQDPAEWSRTRSNATACGVECSPGSLPVGAKIKTLSIVFDEGTDSSSPNDPVGVGLAVIDNIYINGTYITAGRGIVALSHSEDDDQNDQ